MWGYRICIVVGCIFDVVGDSGGLDILVVEELWGCSYLVCIKDCVEGNWRVCNGVGWVCLKYLW